MSDIPAREMTLEEWVGGLPDGHRARKELAKLEAEIVQLKKDAAPFQAQIDQRKTYKAHDD